ncbi:phage tail protein [Pantoea sp. JK]|uniref:phage tail protein n=1 Tax=Pantoea sp. JK TaxID=2871703 RepID=UPI0022390A92|nr:phage tail protein [Pantoea sp. JK]MCW6030169.1 phage tail protein [Pantoea sp. JK]
MSSVFHGGNTYIFYNEAADNTQPNNIAYKNIDQLGTFPQVKINSSNTTLETYNDEWTSVLSGNMTIDSVSIVVHYIADNESHQYLDTAYTNGTNFQIKVALYESQDSLSQHYVILSGYISGYQDSADQNAVYDRTYTFTAEELLGRGTATDPAQLRVGDYGVGSDGETTPQYEALYPTGNSFIKVPALRDDNPISTDMGGIAFVDNGGDQTAQLAMPETGNLALYIKNTDHGWTEIPSKESSDAAYVPLSRTVNGKALSSNITLSSTDIGAVPTTRTVNGKPLSDDVSLTYADTGAVPTTRTVNGKPLSNDVSLTYADTGSVPVERTVNGKPLSDNVVLDKSDVGLDAVLNAVQLVTSNNLSDLTDTAIARTNLDVYSKDEAVPIERTVNGKPLSDDVTLTSTDTGSFAIANNLSEGTPVTIRANISAAKSGDNSDITSLTALSGPLRLGADAAAAYDAVTLRQLQASSGSGTATINGVMNNFLGAVEWFVGTRAAMPGGHLPADGQLLSRATYPDLWAAISSGILNSVTEALWQNSGVSGATFSNRGMYSTGDGSTTFRMPDLNGSQSGSLANIYLRGLSTSSSLTAGSIRDSALPNIVGSFSATTGAGLNGFFSGGTGAFSGLSGAINLLAGTSGGTDRARMANANFNASDSNPIYGRDGGGEVRPPSAFGIWLIRVNGLFSAANTTFNVINSDTTLPATGTTVYGGSLRSDYRVAGANYVSTTLVSGSTIGGSSISRMDIIDNTTGVEARTAFTFRHGASGSSGLGGDITCISGELGLYSSGSASMRLRADGTARIQNSDSTSAIDLNASGVNLTGHLRGTLSQLFVGQYISVNSAKVGTNGEIAIFNSNADTTVGVRFGMVNLASGNSRRFYAGDINGSSQLVQTLPNSTGTITVSTSDKNLKNYTGDVSPEDAAIRISKLKPVEFYWNEKFTNDQNILDKPRRGFFAQDAYVIDERYAVKPTDEQLEIDIVWGLEDRAIMADMVATIQLMSLQIANLQSQIDSLNNK